MQALCLSHKAVLPQEETSLGCYEVASLKIEDLKHFCFLSAKVYGMLGYGGIKPNLLIHRLRLFKMGFGALTEMYE